jgi:type I restriction enzyme S subunit
MTFAWPESAIGDVADQIERPEVPIPGRTFRQIGVRLWGGGAYEREPLDGSRTQYARLNRVEKDDIIVNKIWARNGSVAVVPENLTGCYCSTEFPLFRPKPERLDAGWFHWITKTRWFWKQCDSQSRGTSGKNRIRPDRFLAIPIPLPSLQEQRRIVARIEELAAKIDTAQRLRKESSAQGKLLEVSAIDNVFQAAARDYGQASLDQVCLSITDGDHVTPSFTEKGVPFIFVGNVSTGRLHFRGCRFVSEEYFQTLDASRKPGKGDVLYSAVGATLGIPAVVDSDRGFCFQRHVAILKPDKLRLNPRFLWFMLRARSTYELAWKSTTGSAQPTVPLRRIREFPVPIPPPEGQARLVSHLEDLQMRMDVSMDLQSKTAAELDALLPSILDKAFKGELLVNRE